MLASSLTHSGLSALQAQDQQAKGKDVKIIDEDGLLSLIAATEPPEGDAEMAEPEAAAPSAPAAPIAAQPRASAAPGR